MASPELRMVGAAMPPIAAFDAEPADAAGGEDTVAVLLENGALDEIIVGRADAVDEAAGGSTVTVPVTIEQALDEAMCIQLAKA